MYPVSVRLSRALVARLDALAAEQGINRTRLVRRLLEAGLEGRPGPRSDPPGEEELLSLLSERARAGNVAAIRTLLMREAEKDPRQRALLALEQLAEGRDQ